MIKLDAITMRDLLPPNYRADPDAIAASAAVAPDYHRLYAVAGQAMVLANVDNLTELWLDLLAIDLHVDYYDSTLPIEKKRKLVKQSIPLHQKKGTPWAVEELIRIVFGEGHVEEWWEYGGEPYHFRVHSPNPMATPEDARKFRAALESAKNLRSVLEDILIIRTWGDVFEQNTTWGEVLGLQTWGDIFNQYATWGDMVAATQNWGQIYGARTWGNIYSYIWEG